MIAIVNYGLGNIRAFVQAYKRLGIPVTVAASEAELDGAHKIILPGVGAFDWAMGLLNASGLRDRLDHLVMEKKRPVLGVCIGMQMMAKGSDEGRLSGLGWVDGWVHRLASSDGGSSQLPHMGWNDVLPNSDSGLFANLQSQAQFYFLHSYHVVPAEGNAILATTDYGVRFTSAIRCGNVSGTQFHPEKSHGWGLQLLKNFAESR